MTIETVHILAYYEEAQRSLDLSISKGFALPTWENLPLLTLLVITELVEADDASSIEEVKEELADVGIRLSGILQALSPNTWLGLPRPSSTAFSQDGMSWLVLKQCVYAVQLHRSAVNHPDTGHQHRSAVIGYLAEAFAILRGHCALNNGGDLLRLMSDKRSKNSGRPHMHGGKLY
jgi:hypothetical protein